MKNVGYIFIFFMAYLFNGVMSELGLKSAAAEVKRPVVMAMMKDSSVAVYIKDLDLFVHSVMEKSGSYDESYWVQTDELWKALQDRKKGLADKMTDQDRNTIAALEEQYHKMRDKYHTQPEKSQAPRIQKS
jgi:hypothetical protein